MATTPEGKVKRKVKEILATLGVYYVMPVTGGFGNSGIPDILCCYEGVFIGIECKANGNKPTRLQLSHLEEIERNKGVSFVVDESNVNSLKQLIMEKINEHQNVKARS
jgi:Holliday junction resolvase